MSRRCTCDRHPESPYLCPACAAIEAERDEYRSDREEADLDRGERWNYSPDWKDSPL